VRACVTRAQVQGEIKRWVPKLELDHWDLTVVCGRKATENVADCLAEPEYHEATLRFHLPSIPPHQLTQRVVHELLHCHTTELWHLALEWAGQNPARQKLVHDAHERLTSTVTRIALR